MILYLVGVSCVGKSTIGKMLADRIGFSFYDLDDKIEVFTANPLSDYRMPALTCMPIEKKPGLY